MGRLRAARLPRASTERRALLYATHEHFASHHARRGAARGRGWARASRTSPSFSVPAMETVLILGILQVGGLVERPVEWRQSGAHYTVRLRRVGRRAACIFGVVGAFWKTWSTLTNVRGSIPTPVEKQKMVEKFSVRSAERSAVFGRRPRRSTSLTN